MSDKNQPEKEWAATVRITIEKPLDDLKNRYWNVVYDYSIVALCPSQETAELVAKGLLRLHNCVSRVEYDAVKKELEASDTIIEERNKLLNMFECQTHGNGCVPDAIQQVMKMRKDYDSLKAVAEKMESSFQDIVYELGVPQSGYPSPVANAWQMAKDALAFYRQSVEGREEEKR